MASLTLRKHVRTHTSDLLRRVAAEVRKAQSSGDVDSIHDLRVSIRRLRECLRTFVDVYPEVPLKTVRKELKQLMTATERVRSSDIALELLKKAGMDDAAPLILETREHRARYRAALNEKLKLLSGCPFTRSWSKALDL